MRRRRAGLEPGIFRPKGRPYIQSESTSWAPAPKAKVQEAAMPFCDQQEVYRLKPKVQRHLDLPWASDGFIHLA